MKYALHLPNFGTYSDPRLVAALAHEAEDSGWDGFFMWDHVLWRTEESLPVADPWVLLAAIAMSTSTIRLGNLITPLPRRRPWQVARQAATIDHLSGGRLVLGAGIGGDWFGDYSAFGEPPEDKLHGEMLDEALEIVAGLWSGAPFSYSGKHFTIKDAHFLPAPQQQPRIPIWVAGNWPNKKPFRRAARWDGAVPEGSKKTLTPDDYRDLIPFIKEHRTSDGPFDITTVGQTPTDLSAAADMVAPYAEVGVTWWLERFTDWRGPLEDLQQRIRQGPPRG